MKLNQESSVCNISLYSVRYRSNSTHVYRRVSIKHMYSQSMPTNRTNRVSKR